MYRSKLAKPEVKPHFYWHKEKESWLVKSQSPKWGDLEFIFMLMIKANPLKANK